MERKKIAVIGLGHFGLALAQNLSELGMEVLATDLREERVELLRDKVAHAVVLDATDQRALAQIGMADFDIGIVAIGEGFESSILVTAHLQEIGVPRIISRVVSPVHERVLSLMGVAELVYPEQEAAFHLARVLTLKGIVESVKIGGDYSIIEAVTPERTIGKVLKDLSIRDKYKINLITVIREQTSTGVLGMARKSEKNVLGVPSADLVFEKGDVLVLFGKDKDIRRFLDEGEKSSS